jgi:hypothetical protein
MGRQYFRNRDLRGTAGFFISADGSLFEVEGGSHISTVIGNPSKFGVTLYQIKRVYDFFRETPGVEGLARRQILTLLIRQGCIRLRRYPNKGWSVNVPGLTPPVANVLQDWAVKFLTGFGGFREPDPYMPVIITGLFGKVERFSISEISEGALSDIIQKESKKTGLQVRFLESPALLPDVPCLDESNTALEPRVGIFFLVDGEWIIESMPISQGEDDGDFVNDPRSHHGCWEAVSARLEKRRHKRFGDKSYDYYPRGRCLYSRRASRFFVYVDPCISKKLPNVQNLLYELQVPSEIAEIRDDDPHYRCAQCNRSYVPD